MTIEHRFKMSILVIVRFCLIGNHGQKCITKLYNYQFKFLLALSYRLKNFKKSRVHKFSELLVSKIKYPVCNVLNAIVDIVLCCIGCGKSLNFVCSSE
jgi:hypothetical protein